MPQFDSIIILQLYYNLIIILCFYYMVSLYLIIKNFNLLKFRKKKLKYKKVLIKQLITY